ncbi:LuxR C-terminal-related transcriptional regulator [Flavivirga aquimarina]|uniref:LuxR C-terminal-related transcriptional regulator n=1 Tax=Flavivirga aquimarina TaxID=2027862 RepID=A0ABT8W729_9FLAO|nr:LuxR C-terminal-related transcriptional regulator [Flavivirga aquimarina]MDO5968916.1 LuxR C-terminal-related transcriptional regulator [Flavivirga aquimarina]
MTDLYLENFCKKNVKQRTELTSKEIYYLRLISHGCQTSEICDFLNVKKKTLYVYTKRVKDKLKCKTNVDTIIKAFKLNILDKYDFVEESIKDQASIYADTVSNRINELTEDMGNNSINTLGMAVVEFYETCEMELQAKSKVFFNLKEKSYLELKFKGLPSSFIIEELKLSIDEVSALKKSIFQKLKTHEWFNSIKKGFNYGILNRQDYLSLDMYTEALDCASKIMAIKSFTNLTDKEKHLVVYHQLIDFYNVLEYNCLLKMKAS